MDSNENLLKNDMYDQRTRDLFKKVRARLAEKNVKYNPSILTDEHLFFFLTNDSNLLETTVTSIETYIGWRCKYSLGGPISKEEVQNEINDDKVVFYKPNKNGAISIILKVKNNIPGKNTIEEKMKFLMYNLDIALSQMKAYNTTKMCIVWDRRGSDGDKNMDKEFRDSLNQYKGLLKPLNILDLVDKVYVIEIGMFYKLMWPIAKLFTPQRIIDKVSLLDYGHELLQYFESKNLTKDLGGSGD